MMDNEKVLEKHIIGENGISYTWRGWFILSGFGIG